jgi:uncharacterized protein (DUF2147 family)
MRYIFKHVVPTLLLSLFLAGNSFAAQGSIVGSWKTIDDETNKARSIVKIYKKGGKYFGRITRLYLEKGEDPNPVCVDCKDSRKNKPVKGMIVIKNMVKKGKEYVDGNILDPEDGNVYKCKIWLENGKLKVRGYAGIFYRTQSWVKI